MVRNIFIKCKLLFTCHSIALGPSKQINVDSRQENLK